MQVDTAAPPNADASIKVDASLVQLHRRLVAELSDAVVAAVRACPGSGRRDYRRELGEVGVDALGGSLADALATLAHGTDPDAQMARAYAYRAVMDLLENLGSGTVRGHPSGREDVFQSLPPLLVGPGDDVSPTIALRVGVAFAGLEADQRTDLLHLAAALDQGADVRLVASDAAAHRILEDHREDVSARVLRELENRHRHDGVPAAEADEREAAATARAELDPNARTTGVVRALARATTNTLTYDELASELSLESAPYEAVRVGREHDLVETQERADGVTVVSLRPAGDSYLDSLASADGGRADADAAAASSSGVQTTLSEHPQISPAMPCSPGRPWDPPGPGEDDDGTDRPAAEAAEAADMDRLEAWRHGLVTPQWADRVDWVPAAEHAEPGELSLVDVDLLERLDVDRDGRAPLVSYDAGADAVYVGVEYANPMQSAVALAHGLTSSKLLDAVDAADRMGEDLRGLDISERAVLWSASCLGWLPAEVDSGADYVDELTDARDDLLHDSGRTWTDDVSRSSVARRGLGLIGTMVTLLDLLGVEVVLEARVPTCARHFSADGNDDRRDDLLGHLRMLSALTSRVGAFSLFRQLHEDRAGHRSDAFTPTFDDGDQPSTGSMQAGLLVTGDGVESLGEELADELNPRPLHDDAPDLRAHVDVTTGSSRRRTSRTCRRMLRSRGLRPTAAALAVFAGVASTPWAAAEAIHRGLAKEDRPREVHLDEVRRALARLKPSRILDESSRSARRGVAALLAAEEPISQAELARRADISTQSWRNHRDGLVAADWVRETDAGWRVALPFRDERGAVPELGSLPWYLRDDPDGRSDRRSRRTDEVLTWLAWERGALDGHDAADPDDVLGHALEVVPAGLPRCALDPSTARAALEAAGVPPDLVLAGCDGDVDEPPSTTVAALGESTRQTSLV